VIGFGVLRRSVSLGVLRGQGGRDPALWFRRGVGQFTDVAATAEATTGDAAAAWQDVAIIALQATPTARPTRQAGGELLFDGGDIIGVTDATFGKPLASGFAVSAWVRRTRGASETFVARDGLPTSQRSWSLEQNGSSFYFFFANSGGVAYTPSIAITPINQWALVTGVISPTSGQCFVNEGAGTPITWTGTLPSVNDPVTIGGRTNIGQQFAVASIGDIRIWHRALSAAEIAALFAAERSSYGV
jgi:hypothetical protein